jgi:hypothetical protein
MRPLRSLGAFARLLTATLPCLGACETRAVPTDAGLLEPSPNASILPAPLAAGPEAREATTDAAPSDAGLDAESAPPTPVREDEPLPPDTEELRELSGLNLHARFRWPDIALPPRLPEANGDTLDRARSAATFELEVTAAAAGRLRVVLATPRFVLPAGSEFRARDDDYGHVLVWPDGGRYVVVQPGALRGMLNERRADVVPLAHVSGMPRGSSQAFGYPAERISLPTALGRLELEQARVAATGAGGALLCRFLVEIAGVHPDTAACRSELVPVRAEYSWTDGGRLLFETTQLERSSTLDLVALRTPPPAALHRIGEVPLPDSALLLERAQLRALRLRPTSARPSKDAPKDGLLFVNGDDLLRYAFVDGIPVARLEAKSPGLVVDLLAGTYFVAARTFLGDEVTPPALVAVPGRFVAAEAPRQEGQDRRGE